MPKKTILFIEDDPKIKTVVNSALSRDYELIVVETQEQANASLAKKIPELIIIDFDLKPVDGLQLFKALRTSVNTVMLSASNSIPLAVSASKAGVAGFLRKPVNVDELLETVAENIVTKQVKAKRPAGLDFLAGESVLVKKIFLDLKDFLLTNKDLILLAGQGIPHRDLVEYIHINSAKPGRQLICLDLTAFQKEDLETHFWSGLAEIMKIPESDSLQDETDRYGTICLLGLEQVDSHFSQALFDFFNLRRLKIDKGIRAIVIVKDEVALAKLKTGDFSLLAIPALRQRKEDLPSLLAQSIKKYSAQYDKNINFIATVVLDFLARYDFPGNYLELEKMVQEAVLSASADKIEAKDFPFDFKALVEVGVSNNLARASSLQLARADFENKLYQVLLAKSNNDREAVANFMDLPKQVLVDRLDDLLD